MDNKILKIAFETIAMTHISIYLRMKESVVHFSPVYTNTDTPKFFDLHSCSKALVFHINV